MCSRNNEQQAERRTSIWGMRDQMYKQVNFNELAGEKNL